MKKIIAGLSVFVLAILIGIVSPPVAKADVPLAARLLAEPYQTTGVRVHVNGLGNMHGLANDGTTAYMLDASGNIYTTPLGSIDKTPGGSVTVTGTEHIVGWGAEGAPSMPTLESLSISYSHGCLFITNDSNTEGSIDLYCIDVSDYSVTQITVPVDKPLPEGAYFVRSSLIDFQDGRIGKVSKYVSDGEGGYNSTLRTYTVTGTGKNATIVWSHDYDMYDTSNFAVDEHGIATDGTYLYRIQWKDYNPNTKVWALTNDGSPAEVVYSGNYTMPFGNMHFLSHNHAEKYYLVGNWDNNNFFITSAADPGPGPGNALTATFGTPTKTADGYTVQITNYDAAFTWSVNASLGSAVVDGSGLVTVTGLDPNTSSTVTVETSRTNYPDGSSDVTGSSRQIEMVETNLSTCEQLLRIDDYEADKTKNYTLANDIDCSAVSNFEPIGRDSDGWAGGSFEGTFNGQGHTISGLHMNYAESAIGLFGNTHNATISNLHLTDGSITVAPNGWTGFVGSFVGFGWNTSLHNVSSDLSIEADGTWAVGGIVGYSESESAGIVDTSITGASYTGEITGSSSVGGIVGAVEVYEGYSFTIQKSFSDALVVAGDGGAGGITGSSRAEGVDQERINGSRVLLLNNYSRSTVVAVSSTSGGIIGDACSTTNDANIKSIIEVDKSYSSGNVIGQVSQAGGLIGFISCATSDQAGYIVTNSFVAGRVETDTMSPAFGIVGGNGWRDGLGSFTISNNVVDEDLAMVDGLGSYFEGDSTTSVHSGSTNPNYFVNNTTNAPLNTWDFDAVWGSHESEYPTFLAGAVAVNLDSAEDGSAIRIAQTGCDSIDTSTSSKEAALSVQDPAFSYPVGFASFSMTGCGNSVAITAIFTGSFDTSKITIRKYNSATHAFTTLTSANSGLVLTTTTLGGKPALAVNYTITDGGLLDQDGSVNGSIVDPIGVGLSVVAAPNTGLGI